MSTEVATRTKNQLKHLQLHDERKEEFQRQFTSVGWTLGIGDCLASYENWAVNYRKVVPGLSDPTLLMKQMAYHLELRHKKLGAIAGFYPTSVEEILNFITDVEDDG